MRPIDTLTDFSTSHDLDEIHARIELLVKIAMITDNGHFDKAEERKDLFFFIENLKRCLSAAYSLAERHHRHLLLGANRLQKKGAM
jgi:hypothetical protein